MPKKVWQRNEPFWPELLPAFALRLRAAIGIVAERGMLVVISRGFARRDEQAILHDRYLRGGPLAAPPGKSWHEYRCAADVVPFFDRDADQVLGRDELTWEPDAEVWRHWVDAVKQTGMNSGRSYQDSPHVEYHPGLSIDQALKLGPPNLDNLGIWSRLVV